ncbi:CYTH domain-containing protein [Paracoccus sp. KR1-242]|uniref:CYTH domain-containing protein n=1 Tax=Paracoccus sp. KR1-242 TaxID=3410028 RepID=UPI003BFB8F38
MPKEIERKFLVANDLWRAQVLRKVNLRDGLVAVEDGRKVRIRFYDDRATLTVKGKRIGISRDEFEYEIPANDARIMLEQHCDSAILEKTRHHLMADGQEWVVDEYHGLLEGVVLAEIELPSEDAAISSPPWLGEEVTGNDDYRKTSMVRARVAS